MLWLIRQSSFQNVKFTPVCMEDGTNHALSEITAASGVAMTCSDFRIIIHFEADAE